MDNKPDNSSDLGPKPNDELTPTPSYEQEPATGDTGGDSPFGAPISNVGSTSPGSNPDTQPIVDITPPPSSPNIKSGDSSAVPPVVNDGPTEPVAASPSEPNMGEEPDFGGSMSDTGASSASPVGSPGVESSGLGNLEQNNVEVDPVTAESVAPTASTSFAAKKKRTGLWVTIISVVVLLAALAGGYFYLKMQADNVASSYTDDVKTYLTQVETAGTTIESDPIGSAEQISELTRPTLDSVMLEVVSSDYADAVQLQKDVDSKVSAVLSKVVEIQNQLEVPDFVEEYELKLAEGQQILADTDEDEVDAAYLAYLLELQALVEDATLPVDLDESKTALDGAITDQIAIYTARTAEESETGAEQTNDADTTQIPTLEEAQDAQAEAFGQIKAAEESVEETVVTLTQEAVAALEALSTFRASL